MSFFAVFLALLIEQVRPLLRHNPIHAAARAWVNWVRQAFYAGQSQHGLWVWALAVGLPVVLTALIHRLLWSYSLVLTFVWAVAVLYATLGFRQFSHHFTSVRLALERGDDSAAHRALAEWQGLPLDQVPRTGLVMQAIECSALSVHKHVLGVLVCFLFFWLLGLGPAGAVLFRLADHVAASSRKVPRVGSASPPAGPAGSDLVVLGVGGLHAPMASVAAQAWRWINHVPTRATALAFAVVGNFEEAVANWRQESELSPERNDRIVVAATVGALNLKLLPAVEADSTALVQPPQLAHLTSLVGLVWRSVVLWMLFLALVTLAHSVG